MIRRPLAPLLLIVGTATMISAGFAPNQADPVAVRYAKGLEVWRKAGPDNTPCAFCHSPDGIELAAYDFSDDTIRRRSIPHLGPKDAEAIVDFIKAVREKYGFTKRLDPMKERPFQPGGRILKSDEQFAEQMADQFPAMAETITSESQLKALLEASLLAEPRQLPVALSLNRLSEDAFHGLEHATLAHWFPDTPFRPTISWDILFTVHDQYLADPTDKLIGAMQDFAPQRLVELSTPADQMAMHKFGALVIYQHDLRMKALGRKPFAGNDLIPLESMGRKYLPNPIWDLGEFASKNADLDFKSFHFPEKVVANKTGAFEASEQLKAIRIGWLWAGWMLDQGFLRAEYVRPEAKSPTHKSNLLTKTLLDDGPFPAHAAYAMLRKTALRSTVGNDGLVDQLGAFLDPERRPGRLTHAPTRRLIGNAALLALYADRARGAKSAQKSTALAIVAEFAPESVELANGL